MRLNTGAEVLRAALAFDQKPQQGYVLARTPDDYVVWHVYRHTPDGIWECEMGHYFTFVESNTRQQERCYAAALESFRERAYPIAGMRA